MHTEASLRTNFLKPRFFLHLVTFLQASNLGVILKSNGIQTIFRPLGADRNVDLKTHQALLHVAVYWYPSRTQSISVLQLTLQQPQVLIKPTCKNEH